MRPSRSEPVPGDVLVAMEELGLDVDKVRRDEVWASCPAHLSRVGNNDRKASWSVNMLDGSHHCFSCGWGGSFVDLVIWMGGAKDPESGREWVRKHGGLEAAARRFRGDVAYTKKKAEKVTEADMALFVDPPLTERNKRGLGLYECRQYGVRWNLENNSWIVPIHDPYSGDLIGWQEKNKRMFLNQPENLEKSIALFGLTESTGKTAILVESPLDVVYLATLDYSSPLSSFGVHVSESQMRIIIEEFSNLVLALDNDKAGYAEMKRIQQEYRGRIPMSFINYDGVKEKDPGEMQPNQIAKAMISATSSVVTRF